MNSTSMLSNADSSQLSPAREDFSEYVAHLQLHMALHARKLVPSLTHSSDSRANLLHETQANFEKFISRQAL